MNETGLAAKSIFLPLAGALVGGGLVWGLVQWKPELLRSQNAASAPRLVGGVFPNDDAINQIFRDQERMFQHFDQFFGDDFFRQSDPFAEMRKMRERLRKQVPDFGSDKKSKANPFDSWFADRFGGGSVEEISQREDKDFVYYDIEVGDVNHSEVKTRVENGYVSITGEVNQKIDGNGSSQIFRSSFQRSFPVPDSVDAEKMEVITEKNVITLKFPKVGSAANGKSTDAI